MAKKKLNRKRSAKFTATPVKPLKSRSTATTSKPRSKVATTGSQRKEKASTDRSPRRGATKSKPVKSVQRSPASRATAATTSKPRRAASAGLPKTADQDGVRCYAPAAMQFLVELQVNNDRDWFKANQERYESDVREPTRAFIRAMAPRLARISPHIVASDQKVGGSMMRPQRDTRFAKDADPYKTNVGVQFRHEAGKDVHAPGFYFHFDPDSVFLGAGIWRPDAPALAKIRAHIDEHQQRWSKVLGAAAFKAYFEIGGSALTRPPKGFSPEHPMIEHLKRKDHIAITHLPHSVLFEADLVEQVDKRFRAAKAYLQLLHDAIGLSF